MFVDFNNNGGLPDVDLSCPECPDFQLLEDDESFVTIAPFLAVFDDDEARDIYVTSTWVDAEIRNAEITEYVTEFAKRIHFNRYTGVVMK